MLKFVSLSLAILIMLSATTTAQQRFEKYQKIEAYEVRPGILLMPRYTVDNEVCEIGLEKLHYSSELIRLDSELSRKEIDEIFDELVPADERGKPSKDTIGNLITLGGHSLTTNIEFENVLIQIYGSTSPSNRKKEIAVNEVIAKVKWKHRICR
jgi:hypothetical protein